MVAKRIATLISMVAGFITVTLRQARAVCESPFMFARMVTNNDRLHQGIRGPDRLVDSVGEYDRIRSRSLFRRGVTNRLGSVDADTMLNGQHQSVVGTPG